MLTIAASSFRLALTLVTGCQREGTRRLLTIEDVERSRRLVLALLRVDALPDIPSGVQVFIHLKLSSGEKIVIEGRRGDGDVRNFAKSLVIGKTYQFPNVWLDYKADHGKTTSK